MQLPDIDVTPELKRFRTKLWPEVNQHPVEVYHTLALNGKPIAYVLTQIVNNVAIPHIAVRKHGRCRAWFDHIKHLFYSVYIPDFKRPGFIGIVTTCAIDDYKTQGLLNFLGFNTNKIFYASLDFGGKEV